MIIIKVSREIQVGSFEALNQQLKVIPGFYAKSDMINDTLGEITLLATSNLSLKNMSTICLIVTTVSIKWTYFRGLRDLNVNKFKRT